MFHESLVRALEQGVDYDVAIKEAAAPMRQLMQSLLDRRPFEPFRIHMTSGSIHEVRVPETCTLAATTLTMRDTADSQTWRCTLALIHVVSIEPLCADEPDCVVHRSIV